MRIVMTFPQRLGVPGGGPIGCQRIAAGLRQLGADVELLVVERGEEVLPSSNLAIPLRTVRPSRLHYLLDGLGIVRTLKNRPRGSVDWILGWGTEAAWTPEVARRLGARFGLILAMPSYRAWLERRTRLKPLKRMVDRYFRVRPARRANLVFALSDFTAREASELLGVAADRVVVAQWGVDPGFFRVERRETATPRVLFYGSLAPNKGVFDALIACGRLLTGGRVDFEVRVAGWGDWEAVRRAAAASGVADQLVCLGTLDRSGLWAELAEAWVALLPSHTESFGLAIAEAQAAGVPVVSYRAGAVPEVVEDGVTGLLCPLGDTEALAQALGRLLGDPVLRASMGEAARDRARRFTWEATATRMLEAMDRYRCT
jgi:glycosyltransferase involved in cell wall biosynthesis